MNRDEIAQEMRKRIIDNDKELIVKAFHEMEMSVARFQNEIGLKGTYKELNVAVSDAHNAGYIKMTFENSLLHIQLYQDEHRIEIKKIVNGNETTLDEIKAIGEKLTCYDGDFDLKEIDKYLSSSFEELLH